jgi:hypothetical protein
MKKVLGLVLAFVLASFAVVFAEPVTTFYGYQWLRYENKVVGSGVDNKVDTSMFSIPRTYLRFKVADTGYEGNITLDINNTANGEGVNTTAVTYTATNVAGAIDWASWLKYASVDLTKVPGLEQIDAQLRVGLQKIYFGTIDTWEYPLIDKDPIDRAGIVSSADTGISILGRIPAGYGSYELAVYSGSGYKKLDTNAEKMYDASLLITPISGIYFRGSYVHNITSDLLATPTLDFNATSAVVGYGSGPFEGWTEYYTRFDRSKTSASASGVLVGWASYVGLKLTDALQVNAMWMQNNPDTKVVRDDRNVWQFGVNYKLAGDAVLLQLGYELDQLKFPNNAAGKGNSTNDAGTANLNYIWSQIKWSW